MMILPEAPELPYVLNGSSAAAGRAAQLREKIPFNCLAIAAFFAAVAGLFQLDIRSIQKAGAHADRPSRSSRPAGCAPDISSRVYLL